MSLIALWQGISRLPSIILPRRLLTLQNPGPVIQMPISFLIGTIVLPSILSGAASRHLNLLTSLWPLCEILSSVSRRCIREGEDADHMSLALKDAYGAGILHRDFS